MRFARKLFTLSVLALAAMAFTASSASAQVEVSNEATGVHCGTVVFTPPHTTSGGCAVNIVNTSTHITLFRHTGTGEVVGDACDNTYRLNVGENGEGYVNVFRATNPGGESPGCGFTVTACDVESPSGNHEPWPIHIEETAANVVHANVRVCLDIVVQVEPRLSCEVEGDVELNLTRNGNQHVTSAEGEGPGAQGVPITNRVVVAHGAPHLTCEGLGAQAEIAGHWDLDPNLIVTHL